MTRESAQRFAEELSKQLKLHKTLRPFNIPVKFSGFDPKSEGYMIQIADTHYRFDADGNFWHVLEQPDAEGSWERR